MKTLTLLAALITAIMLVVTPAFAQDSKQCPPGAAKSGKAPQKIEGEVTQVDPKSGMLTVKRPDGTTHEFKGSAETVRDYKKGDRIELTLRSEPC